MPKINTFLLLTIFMFSSANAMAQNHEITGTVTDAETGETLPGVNITIKGTSQGTTTSLDGEYQIVTEPDDVLSFFLCGVSNKRNLN